MSSELLPFNHWPVFRIGFLLNTIPERLPIFGEGLPFVSRLPSFGHRSLSAHWFVVGRFEASKWVFFGEVGWEGGGARKL